MAKGGTVSPTALTRTVLRSFLLSQILFIGSHNGSPISLEQTLRTLDGGAGVIDGEYTSKMSILWLFT